MDGLVKKGAQRCLKSLEKLESVFSMSPTVGSLATAERK
jgi:hypothetical protein